MFKIPAYVLILLLFNNKAAFSRKPTKAVTFLDTHVEFCTTYLEDHTLKISDDRSALDIVLNVAQNFTQDAWVNFMLAFKTQQSQNFRNLVTYDLNVCNILGKGQSLNLALLWINNFWKYGNLPKSCPIQKGHYNWHGLKVDRASLPTFLLTGEYRATINTYFRKANAQRDSVANLTIFVQIK